MSFTDLFKKKPEVTISPKSTKDPVCGMAVNPETTKYKSTYEGKTYYFCSPNCKETFDQNPKEFVS